MDFELRQRAERLVPPGERLLWWGRPDPSVRFAPADAFLIPFSVLWTGFMVVWEVGASAADAPLLFRLWGVPFLVLGAYFTVGRFVAKARRKRRTVYVLTDRRAIAAVGNRSSVEMPWRDQPREVRRHRDGRHVSVVFGNSGGSWTPVAMYANTGLDLLPGWSRGGTVAFYDVADGQALLAALESARPSAGY